MTKFEFGPNFKKAAPIESPIGDFDENDPEIQRLLTSLPMELREKHLEVMDTLNDKDARAYLTSIVEKRERVSRDSHISDSELAKYFEGRTDEFWHAIETNVFENTDNDVDSGTTAKVKRFDIGANDEAQSLAVKYVIRPTPLTNKVDTEHNILKEVENLERIEQAESKRGYEAKHVQVPHPYFYLRKGKIQCYGMELVDGINLWEATTREYDLNLKEAYQESFKDVDEVALLKEVDDFFDVMHEICVHNDIKPRNIMASREGKFYVIDFGQSILTTNVDEKSVEMIENRKDEEKEMAKKIIQNFLRSLRN